MTIIAEIILDSVSPDGDRLTTFRLRYPRFIHDELLTHRVFSRNASSQRAIPVAKMIEDVRQDPAFPVSWGRNKSGMDAGPELGAQERRFAHHMWKLALDNALTAAGWLAEAGLHKQHVNRVLMPFAHVNVLVTATEFMNFFGLRLHPSQPEIMQLAQCMWEAYGRSRPLRLMPGEWHLPFFNVAKPGDHHNLETIIKVSVARCARVSRQSFLTGKDSTVEEDLELYSDLVNKLPMHASPAEHQATPDIKWAHPEQHGNLTGWRQYRKMLKGEAVAPLPEAYR